MAINRQQDRYMVSSSGSVRTEGGSLLLADGEIGLFDIKSKVEHGCKAVATLSGYRRDDKRFQIRQGSGRDQFARSSHNKNFSSDTFAIDEVVEIYASAPESNRSTVDEVIFGYNGIDEETAIKGMKGDRITINLELSGGLIGRLGYQENKITIQEQILLEECKILPMMCEDCDPCEEVDIVPALLRAIDRIKNQPLTGGYTVGDVIEITPITDKCDTEANENSSKDVYTYCIEMCDTGDQRALGLVQTQYPEYKIIRDKYVGSTSYYKTVTTEDKPDDFEQKVPSVMPKCEDCPQGYDYNEGGYVYSATIEDNGEDLRSSIDTIKGVGSVVKVNGQKDGVGTYIIVAESKLKDEDISELIENSPTVTLTFVAKTNGLCENSDVQTIPWKECGVCKQSFDTYYITMPDDFCGESALEELQQAYPEYEITETKRAGCQGMFETTVLTNIVCEECDPIYEDFFRSEPPEPYNNRYWKKDEKKSNTPPKNCLVGIKFKGIESIVHPTECYIDEVGFSEDSVRISVSGGYPDEVREGIPLNFERVHTEYLSRATKRTHMGGDLFDHERGASVWWSARTKKADRMGRMLSNDEYRLDAGTQYVDISIGVRPTKYAQSMSQRVEKTDRFHIYVPFGQHEDMVEFANMIAAAAGLPIIQI